MNNQASIISSPMTVTELAIYPVKSTRQVTLGSAIIGSMGFEHDRRWMLVDSEGQFITQRKYPRLVLVTATSVGSAIRLSADGHDDLLVPEPGASAHVVDTRVWKDDCQGLDAGDAAAQWLSDFLKLDCRLIYMPENRIRALDARYSQPGERTGYADGFPFLLTTTASLDELNARLDKPVPMKRFRPNIVVHAETPFAEDQWQRIRIGSVTFRVAKPCSRCIMTTVDTERAVTGKEPLKTLSEYRRIDKGVIFGQNLIHESTGEIRVGDRVEVLD
ncbi:MAG: MOSC domain-containing protein [Endozoicomonas sp.]